MAGTGTHQLITKRAVATLPAWEQKILGVTGKKFLNESCLFPDMYFDIETGGYQKALPYAHFIDGIQFHYIPNTPIEPEYKYWKVVKDKTGKPVRLKRVVTEPNLNWKHSQQGFRFYFRQAVTNLRRKNLKKAAGFLGSLLHVLEDGGTGLHSLEGTDGSDIFILDRLMKPARGDISRLPTGILSAPEPENPDIHLGSPALLGTGVEEAVFLLYTRFYQVQSASRKKTHAPGFQHRPAEYREDIQTLFRDALGLYPVVCRCNAYRILYRFCQLSGKREKETEKNLSF